MEMSKYMTQQQGIKSTTPVYSKYICSIIPTPDINGGGATYIQHLLKQEIKLSFKRL